MTSDLVGFGVGVCDTYREGQSCLGFPPTASLKDPRAHQVPCVGPSPRFPSAAGQRFGGSALRTQGPHSPRRCIPVLFTQQTRGLRQFGRRPFLPPKSPSTGRLTRDLRDARWSPCLPNLGAVLRSSRTRAARGRVVPEWWRASWAQLEASLSC